MKGAKKAVDGSKKLQFLTLPSLAPCKKSMLVDRNTELAITRPEKGEFTVKLVLSNVTSSTETLKQFAQKTLQFCKVKCAVRLTLCTVAGAHDTHTIVPDPVALDEGGNETALTDPKMISPQFRAVLTVRHAFARSLPQLAESVPFSLTKISQPNPSRKKKKA